MPQNIQVNVPSPPFLSVRYVFNLTIYNVDNLLIIVNLNYTIVQTKQVPKSISPFIYRGFVNGAVVNIDA